MRAKAMTLGQLKEHLERVYTINGGAAVEASTPHGTYTFEIVAVEDELSKPVITLRLQEKL